MSHTESGMPAYPGQARDAQGNPIAEYMYGLTKRELFAAMAMQGMLAAERPEEDFVARALARRAVAFGDALIESLSDDEVTP